MNRNLKKLVAGWKCCEKTGRMLPVITQLHKEVVGEIRTFDNHNIFFMADFHYVEGDSLHLIAAHVCHREYPARLEVHIPEEASISLYSDGFTVAFNDQLRDYHYVGGRQ